VYLTFTRVWPVSVSKRVDDAISSLLRHLSAIVRASSSAARLPLAVEARAALGAIEADLELLAYEPASIRQGEDWLQARRRAAAEMAALKAPLLLLPDVDPILAADVARRLDSLAARSPAERFVQRDFDLQPADRRTPAGMVGEHLRNLEHALSGRATGEGVANHASL
jgi:multidrug resistance protein MdtO